MRRILDAAIEVFAAEGYDGTSTRALAERAKVNLPAIQYYFGSKEGLYRAAIDHIAGFIEARMAPAVAHAEAALAAGESATDELIALIGGMLDGFIDLVTCSGAPPAAGMLIARAEIENAAALDPLQQVVFRLIFHPCMALVGRLLGRSAEDEEVKIRTFAIFGQALVFKNHGTKAGACPALGWAALDQTRLETIRGVLRAQTNAILRAALSERA